jgi:hypothetical protein
MFFLIGLMILNIKIGILATGYSFLTLQLFKLLAKVVKIKFLNRLIEKKLRFCLVMGIIYLIPLYIYAFSFWGYCGLGDDFLIPVGNGYVVSSADTFDQPYFGPGEGIYPYQLSLKKFIIYNQTVCGEFKGYDSNDCKNCFFVFDTKIKKIDILNSPEEYSAFAYKNNLPQCNMFKSFKDNYDKYWNGLRLIFLP